MDYKSAIVSALETMESQSKMDKKKWEAISYGKVLKQIRAISVIHSMDDLEEIKGIGEGIRKKLYEIFETGSLAAAEKIKAIDRVEAFAIFQDCYGIGAKKASDLARAGLSTLAQLRAAAAANPKLLTAAQTVGLRCYEEFKQRISRAEMLHHEIFLKKSIPIKIDIVGSFRRGAASSGDIDMLLCSSDPRTLDATVKSLALVGYITDTLAQGEKKFMGVCKLPGGAHRRLDILLTPPDEYPFALVYFTGPMELNVVMRKHCLDLGLSLNEHGFTSTGAKTIPEPTTEEELFACLGLPWIKPEDRDKKKLK